MVPKMQDLGKLLFIAGIVIARRAALATRNVKHFADLTAEVVNPWEAKQ